MRTLFFCLALLLSSSIAAHAGAGPTDPKAQKTFAEAERDLKNHQGSFALDSFRKANKQDGGHCTLCLEHAYRTAVDIGDYKAAQEAAGDLINLAQTPQAKAEAHLLRGLALLREGTDHHKDKLFPDADTEFKDAIEQNPTYVPAIYADGLALARLKQDAAARARFDQVVKATDEHSVDHQRALRFSSRPELARARMAPAFAATALDGHSVSLDELAGKVVLLDFWATWCGPCRQALPHMKEITRKFHDQPLVVISVSLDSDEAKWKDFVQKNEMTWLQIRDGGFDGHLSTLFAVHAIPHTFSIDADGVLQDEHVGDASIEGKLKKLLAQAQQTQAVNLKAQSQ